MLDFAKLKYRLILVTETGQQYDISEALTDLGWEDGDKELASRINCSLHNLTYNGKTLSDMAKPNCVLIVYASWGGDPVEVARGRITDWVPAKDGKAHDIELTAYDELYCLQQSQDNRYVSAGTGTKTAITSIMQDWGIPIGGYSGPDIAHAKTVFKNQHLSDMILELLDAAVKKGGNKSVVRAEKGQVYIVEKGSNSTVYSFNENNLEVNKVKISTQGLVTRVKIVATSEDDDGVQKVEALVDGKTEYGIRQRIYNRSEEDSLATAKSAAQEILDEDGSPEETYTVTGPDVPTLRKGDKIHIEASLINGDYVIKSIQHDATTASMTITVEPYEEPKPATDSGKASSSFAKGDAVILNGAVYRDSYGTGKGKTFSNYATTITIVVDTSRACPYHVGSVGWVYPDTIKKA